MDEWREGGMDGWMDAWMELETWEVGSLPWSVVMGLILVG